MGTLLTLFMLVHLQTLFGPDASDGANTVPVVTSFEGQQFSLNRTKSKLAFMFLTGHNMALDILWNQFFEVSSNAPTNLFFGIEVNVYCEDSDPHSIEWFFMTIKSRLIDCPFIVLNYHTHSPSCEEFISLS